MQNIIADVSVTTKDAILLRKAKIAKISMPNGQKKDAKITFLAKVADPNSNTFLVEFEADNSDMALLVGQNIEISVALEQSMAHKLPQYSLTTDANGLPCIKAIDDQGIVQIYRDFELMDEDDTYMWLGNLPETLNVITIGQGYIKEGVKLDLATIKGIEQ
jgi:multidrug efflux system membrane fusion protein